MKRTCLAGVVLIALLLAACGRAQDEETAAPAMTAEPQAESGLVLPAPTYTLYPTYTPYRTHTPQPTDAPPPTATAAEPTPTEAPVATVTPTAPPQESTATATSTPVPQAETAPTRPAPQAPAAQPVDLTRIEDADPGPPLAIQVSTLGIKEDGTYKLTGTVRNDSADGKHQVYGGVGVIATFFTGDPPPNHHGPVEVYAACSLLSPRDECPFSLEIYARNYVSYHLHPKGAPVAHQPASLTCSGLNVYHDSFGYLHITGTATNEHLFAVRDAYIYGTLIDAQGYIASVGMTLAPGEIAPGARVPFDLRIEDAPYVRYEVQAQARRN
jgi:hypothetical protein